MNVTDIHCACRQTVVTPNHRFFLVHVSISSARGEVSNKFVTLDPGIPRPIDAARHRCELSTIHRLRRSTKLRYVEVATREKNYGENDQKRSLLPGGLPHRRFLCLHCAVLTSLLIRTLSNVDAALTTCQ